VKASLAGSVIGNILLVLGMSMLAGGIKHKTQKFNRGSINITSSMLLFAVLGLAIPAIFLHPSEAQHGDLGVVQENDVMLLISNSGKTNEIVALTKLARILNPNLKYIVITGNPESPLAQEADICLATGHPDEMCLLGMTPTTSTTVMTVIGDILVVETMRKTKFTIEEYSKRHHGGYLGERSRELSK
jgi:arabinose-5-phosphate isomerase